MPTLSANSISEAWKQAVSACVDSRDHEVCALTVEIGCEGQLDDPAFREEVNQALAAADKATVETVARTIFPSGLWNPQAPRAQLYRRYMKILPKLRKCTLNRRGHYFERLIHYPLNQKGAGFVNQLEFIISTYVKHSNHRRSALQASLYNPFLDASHSPRLGFPCLQQVAFLPTTGRGLTLVAFYPLHYLFERAYGNYLGLAHLGRFMAKEMGLNLERVVCVAGVAKLEVSPKLVRTLNLSRTEGR
jgi:hypothetical protein